jgi:peroxiredoxin Q/BCP
MPMTSKRPGVLSFVISGLASVAGCLRPGPRAEGPPAGELLAVGTPAPDFTAVAHDGKPVSLSALRGRYVVLYFYPKDDTPGCTKEACEFRDARTQLQDAGVLVFGISSQGNPSHAAFAEKYQLPFQLLPDEKGELAAKYHVPTFMGFTRRVTYLVDREGVIKQVWPNVKPAGHAADILAQIGRGQSPPGAATKL